MAAPQFASEPSLIGRPETREVRIRFANRSKLLEGLARARSEAWVADARVDQGELVLVLGTRSPRHLRTLH